MTTTITIAPLTIFEKATQQQLRFDSSRGPLSVEQLWQLPLKTAKTPDGPTLYGVGREVEARLKEAQGGGFFSTSEHRVDETVQLQFDVVKRIVEVREAEANAKELRKQNEQRLAELKAVRARKLAEATEGLPIEDLDAQIRAVEASLS